MPSFDQGKQHRQVLREWRVAKMLIHRARAGEQARKCIPAKGQRQ